MRSTGLCFLAALFSRGDETAESTKKSPLSRDCSRSLRAYRSGCLEPMRFLAVALMMAATCPAEESRLWTSKANGRQFKGALVGVEEGYVLIRRESDQVIFRVKRTDLVQGDLDWIEKNPPKTTAPGDVEDLSALVSGVPAATGTPAIGVFLVMEGDVRGLGVSGVRKAGDETKVERGDKWHLGSCTKSMTATLAATLVEEGVLNWETTVSEALGEKLRMREEYESVTLGMLLANRGGIPGKVPDSVYAEVDRGARVKDLKAREILKQRAKYVEAVLNLEPSRKPDTGFEYSNAGFVIAGAMMEQVTGKPWETLMEERLFRPLGMGNSGFGNAAHGDKRKPTQPWPHKNGSTPFAPGEGDDNSWVIGPAGTVHCSLEDVARYVSMHAARETGPVLKKKETFAFLHKALPQNENYARGWIGTRTAWSQGAAISHDGSNTMNHCSIWVAPERKAAVAAFTNCGENGRESCMSAIESVVAKYLE